MKIAIGCDHPAFPTKQAMIDHLLALGHTVYDCGTFFPNIRTHYPIYGHKIACLVASKKVDCGVAICGTGIGISNACNKVAGIRCALVSDALTAKIACEKYGINIIAMGGLVVGINTARDIIDSFLNAVPQPVNSSLKNFLQKIDTQLPCLTNQDDLFTQIIADWVAGKYTNGQAQAPITDAHKVTILEPPN